MRLTVQWQIQDFLEGGVNLLFGKTFAENYMKMKEFGPRRGVPITPLTRHCSLLNNFQATVDQTNLIEMRRCSVLW